MNKKVLLFAAISLFLPLMLNAKIPESNKQLDQKLTSNASNHKPITITSDLFSYNEQNKTSLYSGNVKLVQDEKIITAAAVNIYHDTQHKITTIVAEGEPANFKLLASNKTITGHAKTLRLDVSTQILELVGNAVIHHITDTFSAPVIKYDISKQIIKSENSKNGRTKIVISPDSIIGK